MNTKRVFLVLGVALASAGCALDATPGGNDPAPEATATAEPVAAPNDPAGGNPCTAILHVGRDGQLEVDGYLCPMPAKPIPDPAFGTVIPSEPEAIANDGQSSDLEH